MIRITRQTDYGIVLLTHMATYAERRFNAPELAAEVHLPLPMVSKILKVLTRERLLESHRGTKGGYSLARPAAAISMAEIVSALEGPIAITECIEESTGCSLLPACQVHTNWQRINEALLAALAGISLAEMTRPAGRLVTIGGGGGVTDRPLAADLPMPTTPLAAQLPRTDTQATGEARR